MTSVDEVSLCQRLTRVVNIMGIQCYSACSPLRFEAGGGEKLLTVETIGRITARAFRQDQDDQADCAGFDVIAGRGGLTGARRGL
jgi:hypothetical protein